eukprot:2230323-Amphidinium_carterae.6
MLLLACCYGKKPRIEMRITSNTQPRNDNELDIIILQVRAIQGFFTDNRGEDSMNLDKAAALYNPVANQMIGRFGYPTTMAQVQDFQKSGIIPGGPADNNYSWEWDISRECVHMTPVAPMHAEAIGIWKSEGHGWRQGSQGKNAHRGDGRECLPGSYWHAQLK